MKGWKMEELKPLKQACTTCGPWATCGPLKDFLWPRGDRLNCARAPEKLPFKINIVHNEV
jgi:hypothetical protein